jgi:DNA-nicking Smr family endonuclease
MAYKNTTGNDGDAWQQATRDFKPLHDKKPRRVAAEAQQKTIEIKISHLAPMPNLSPQYSQKTSNRILEPGDMSRVDGSIARKLREGSYPIDATLDLHGRTQNEAFETLSYYITTAYSMGKRCILVITGKGTNGQGVIREQLPKWLNNSGLQDYILAINQAHSSHGSSGAFYVLLRKNR